MGDTWNNIVAGCVETVTGPDGKPAEVATLKCLPAVFQNIIVAALSFAGIIALFFLIYSGIKFINSGGDAKQVEGARQTATYAIIGLIVVLMSFFIVNLIAHVTGAKCILNFGFVCQEP